VVSPELRQQQNRLLKTESFTHIGTDSPTVGVVVGLISCCRNSRMKSIDLRLRSK
jgi:hypothetical protein